MNNSDIQNNTQVLGMQITLLALVFAIYGLVRESEADVGFAVLLAVGAQPS